MKTVLLIFCLSFIGFANAQSDDCPCCDKLHRQFDFWIGHWNVFDTSGNQVGENEIVALENHCIINENWTGGQNTTGKSYNYYDRSDSTWNQVWVDNAGQPLVLKGTWNGESMVLKGPLKKGQQVKSYQNVVTWTPNEDGSVQQLWELKDENGTVLRTVFLGIYRKKA